MLNPSAIFNADQYEGDSRNERLRAFDLLERGRELERGGATAEALRKYQEALRLVERLGEKKAAGYLNFVCGVAHYRLRRFDAALRFFQPAFSLWRDNDACEYLAHIRAYLVCLYALRFQYARSLKTALGNLRDFNDRKDEPQSGRTHLGVALILRHGEPEGPNSRRLLARVGSLTALPPRAVDYFQEALRRARRDEYAETLLPALREYAIFLRFRGTPEQRTGEARRLLEEALALADRHGIEAERKNLERLLAPENS